MLVRTLYVIAKVMRDIRQVYVYVRVIPRQEEDISRPEIIISIIKLMFCIPGTMGFHCKIRNPYICAYEFGCTRMCIKPAGCGACVAVARF